MSEEYERYSLDIAKYILIALQMLGGSASRQEIKEIFVEDKQFDLTYHKVFEPYTEKTYSHFLFDFNFGLVALKCCGYIEPYKRNGNIVLTSKGKIFNAKLYPTDEDKKIQQDYWQKAHNKKSNEQAFINWCINHKQLKNQNKLYSKTSAEDFAFMLKKQLCNKIPEIEKEINSSNIFMIIDYELIDAILDKYSNEIYSIDKLANNADGKNSLILYSEFLKGNSFDEQTEQLETIIGGENMDNTKYPLNQILYGPPGTGKTYNTVIKAIEITNPELIQRDKDGNVENYETLKNKFDELKQQGQIEFVTFHQSYSYEEFVEGIKPDLESNELKYKLEDGIFKKICNSAKINIEGDFENIYSQFIEEIDENHEFKTQKGSFKIRVNDNDGLTIRTGDNFEKETCGTITKEQIKNQTFTSIGRKQKLEAITKYLKEKYGLTFSASNTAKPHILIIDEINRGDVSKIFGELITIIEEDKRIGKEHQMTVTLPYSRETFGVPYNLYIIGTMNTADRSIALLDTALRRRFDFEEMMPKPELLRGKDIEGVDLEQLLTNINDRIKNEYDRDHQIGHSYLMEVENKEQLERAYKNRILPLLNEYFYNDIDSVAKVLNCKPDDISSKENWFDVLKEAQKPTKKDNEQ